MKDAMTHERCSELLGQFARDELDDEQVGAIEGHLAACDDCRQELRGLMALLDYQFEGLTGTELVRLERAITAAMKADRDEVTPVTPLEPRGESRRSFAGVFLGAAATLLVVTFAILSLQGGEDNGDGGGDAAVAPESDAAEGGAGDIKGPHPVFAAGATALGTASKEESEDNLEAERNALFVSNTLTDADLERVGKSRLFQRFAAAYDSEDAAALQDQFVAELAQDAGSGAGTVTLCSRNTLEASTGPALPVVGSFARFDGDRALLLGFIYTDRSEGPLNRYSVWVWPRGSCDSPLRTASGNVP